MKILFILAPGSYSPEKCNMEHQPAYSFGGRYDTEKPYKTPGKIKQNVLILNVE